MPQDDDHVPRSTRVIVLRVLPAIIAVLMLIIGPPEASKPASTSASARAPAPGVAGSEPQRTPR